jgi:hypothetical protein
MATYVSNGVIAEHKIGGGASIDVGGFSFSDTGYTNETIAGIEILHTMSIEHSSLTSIHKIHNTGIGSIAMDAGGLTHTTAPYAGFPTYGTEKFGGESDTGGLSNVEAQTIFNPSEISDLRVSIACVDGSSTGAVIYTAEFQIRIYTTAFPGTIKLSNGLIKITRGGISL